MMAWEMERPSPVPGEGAPRVVVVGAGKGDRDAAAVGGEGFEGVEREVEQDLFHLVLAGEDLSVGIGLDVEGDGSVAVLGQGGDERDDAARDVRQRNELAVVV